MNGLPEWEAVIHWLWKEYSDDMSKLRRMKDLLRKAAPILLIGALLLLNLLDLGGTQKQQPAPEAPEQPERKAPTPAPPWATDPYPDLPGRIYFRSGNDLVILERGRATGRPLPAGTILAAQKGPAFSPDGRYMALFAPSGDQLFLARLPLLTETGPLWEFPVPDVGMVRWSPDGQEMLTWTLDGSTLTLRLLDGSVRHLPFAERVTNAVWSPDSQQVAIETEGDSLSLHILDRGTGQLGRIEGTDPVWGPRGLLYRRPSAPDQGFVRDASGEEIPTRLTEMEVWAQARVLDLALREDGPGIFFRAGSPPAEIRLMAMAPGAQRDSFAFSFQVGEPAERFGMGLVVKGALQLWLLPVVGDGLCQPLLFEDLPGGLFLYADGPNCRFQIRLFFGTDQVQWLPEGGGGRVDSTGNWLITGQAGAFMATSLADMSRYTLAVPGELIHWDGR